ncbi:DNA polymerase III subunit delta [Thalassotalea sp. LPB0316]|uniref:DNA polymerase III subunit delta n=1 Tax=Thalassotalea sp. LPB0316 TaxID=2769490 RepID=UPI001867EEB9|nr:DNA polymerase III subunit delta [Thalassotalea sp. LPB0316]QOL24462.1 DNA polymerase III subunit delta [Thalassotalea sp. LPB0316]
MRVYHNKLSQSLSQGLPLVCLVFGDEPWQKIDSLNQIKQHAKAQGFDETIQFSADTNFDWQEVHAEYYAMSLFSGRKIIEVELTNNKVSEAGNKLLTELANDLTPDNLLIIHGGKLEARITKQKWFTHLDKQGIYVAIYDVEGRHLSQWLTQQARQLGLSLTPEANHYMVTILEGNLLAMSQELEKFALLYPNQQLDIEQVEALTIKQAKFNPFQLVDTLLTGNFKKLILMLESLAHDGVHASQLVWILHKEISQLAQMHEQIAQGVAFAQLCKDFRIWEKRKPVYQQALQNTALNNLYIALGRLADIDQQIKSSSDFDDMLLLTDACISVFHGDVTNKLPLDYSSQS